MDRGIGNDEKVLISSNVEDIKFRINTAEHGSELEFRLLEMILSKTFTLLFMLNGGAAVALLAFWGNYITYDATSIRGILWALGFFPGEPYCLLLSPHFHIYHKVIIAKARTKTLCIWI